MVCRFLDDGHSDWCEVVSHWSFDLHFSNNEWFWASFLAFVSHLCVFFGEMSWSFSHLLIGLFVFLLLSCMSCLYILEINSFSVVSFAITFSHSEGCLFILPVVTFVVKKFLHLTSSHLFVFYFVSITLGGGSYCPWGSQGKNTEVVCHSLLQGTTLCQTSPPWPSFLGGPTRPGSVSLS